MADMEARNGYPIKTCCGKWQVDTNNIVLHTRFRMQIFFLGAISVLVQLLLVTFSPCSRGYSLFPLSFLRSLRRVCTPLMPPSVGASSIISYSQSAEDLVAQTQRRRASRRVSVVERSSSSFETRESWYGIQPKGGGGVCEEEGEDQFRHDLWIVGAGKLGTLVAQEWRRRHPHSAIVMETLTEARHPRLRDLGFEPRLRRERSTSDWYSAHNVLISFPPSSCANASAEVAEAARLWVGAELEGDVRYPELGLVLLTSSSGVYRAPGPPEKTDGPPYVARSLWTVNEKAALDQASPRAKTLIDMEREALNSNGSVIRLAGLYDADRGPHSYWLSGSGSAAGSSHRRGAAGGGVGGGPSGAPSALELVNLIHYSDAAKAVVAAFDKAAKRAVYLASDGHPMTRREIAEAALASGLFPGANMPEFDDSAYNNSPTLGPWGKAVDCSWTMGQLRWRPAYPSFREFMERFA